MKKSKTILYFELFGYLFAFVTVLYCGYVLTTDQIHTKYTKETTQLDGIVDEVIVRGDLLTVHLRAEETVLVRYVIKTELEKNKLIQELEIGKRIRVMGEMKQPPENRNFNLFNYQLYLRSLHVYWIMESTEIEIKSDSVSWHYKWKQSLLNRITDSAYNNGYAQALLFGDTSQLSENVVQSFQINGITHLLAVSGMHITILSVGLLWLLEGVSPYKKINYSVLIGFLLFYMFVTNFTPSVIRATFFFVLLTIKRECYIPLRSEFLLLLIASILLCYNPYYLYHLGFQFSFIITFYLIFYHKSIVEKKNYVTKSLFTSFLAFVASIPILIQNFFTINIFSIAVNIVMVPIINGIAFPLAIASVLIPDLQWILAIVTKMVEYVSMFCSKLQFLTFSFSNMPLYGFCLYYLVIIFCFSYYEKTKKMVIFCVLLLVLMFHYYSYLLDSRFRITMIDVGQGDSFLLQAPYSKKTILIDTGGTISFPKEKWQDRGRVYSTGQHIIVPFIKSIGIKKLDYVFLTHGDADHSEGALGLMESFPVKQIIMNKGNINDLEKTVQLIAQKNRIPVRKAGKEILVIDDVQFYFLNDGKFHSENNNSLVFYVNFYGKKLLWMGDAEKDVEEYLLKKGDLSAVDILKVGHHGSKTSSSKEFLYVVNPSISLISSGASNRYGHPHSEVLERLEMIDSAVFSTSKRGMVQIICDAHCKVRTRFEID